MKIAFRHIQNDCVLCHANKLKAVGPMGECLPITEKFVMGACWTSHFHFFLSFPVVVLQSEDFFHIYL